MHVDKKTYREIIAQHVGNISKQINSTECDEWQTCHQISKTKSNYSHRQLKVFKSCLKAVYLMLFNATNAKCARF